MKQQGTFGNRAAARRKKARTAKRLAVTTVLILLATFVVKEILKEQLKDLRDSIVSAQNQFSSQLDQSAISVQILTTRQQLETAEIKAARSDPHHDYALEILQATTEARQVQAQMRADFEGVSKLVDAIPGRTEQLRQLRDQLRTSVEKADQTVNTMLDAKPKDDIDRWVGAKLAMVMALVQELPIIILGDVAQKSAQLMKETIETLIKFCNWLIYVLGILGFILGLYAAINGFQSAES
jgi:hypothetical protein